MRWTNFVTLSQALWLGAGHAASILSSSSRAALAPRQNPPSGAGDGFVYRGDRRSPREIRNTGGMRPQGDGWEAHDSSFDLDRHYSSGPNGCGLDDADEPGFVFRTAYVSAAQGRATAERYGDWLYEVRATPNVLDNGDNEGEVMGLGGFHWRQIRRYTRMRDAEEHRVDEAQWMDNPEYDAETYERGPHAAQCRVSTAFPRVLAGEAPSSDSDSDSDSDSQDSDEGAGAGPSRRLFNAADIFMDRTPGMFELYGEFPPRWQTFPPRDDIPGPDHPTPPVAEDDQAGQLLQHYIDMGVQELNRLFPGGDQILEELFRDIRPIGCPSLTGFGSHLGRSEALADRRARRATTGKHGCCKMLSSFKKKTHNHKAKGPGGVVEVDICKNGPLNPPCTAVKAPSGTCVAMPKDYKDTVSGVKTHEASSICRFYRTPDCKGEYFEASHHAVDLPSSRPTFNDKVASMKCDTFTPAAAPARWEWSATSQPKWCERLDQLHLDFALANNHGSGTYDKIKLAFDGAGQKPHVIVEGPSPGDKISQDINLRDIFGMDTVAVDQIKRVRLLDELTDWTFGGDWWELAGFTLKGRCAGSGIPVVLDKFAALNAGLQARPTDVGRFMYHRDWEVWASDVAAAEWTARPMCSHFRGLGLTLAMEDADWAGTDNSLYAEVGPTGRFLIARSPSRREVFTVDMSVRKAFGVDAVPVGQVDVVGIASEGGHDAAKPKEVTIYGHCSGASHQALSVKQTITEWIYDAETLKINIAPDMWEKA